MFVSFMCLHLFVRLVTCECTRFDNKDSETQAQVRLVSFQNKIKIFQEDILSKAFCHFPNVRMRTNAYSEEAIAD